MDEIKELKSKIYEIFSSEKEFNIRNSKIEVESAIMSKPLEINFEASSSYSAVIGKCESNLVKKFSEEQINLHK